MIKMIVMDLDGTLLNSEKNVSDYSVSILNECKNMGIKIVIATARAEKQAIRCINLIKPDYMILNGGSLVLNKDKKIIYEKYLQINISDGILNELKMNKNIGVITIETITNYYVSQENVKWHNDFMYGIYYNFQKPLSERTYKITVETPNKKIIKNLEKKYQEIQIIEFSGDNWYGIYHKEASKLLAIKAIISETNIPMKNIISFGDDFNDIEMIAKCGIGIAMDNGIEEIKKNADFICGSNNQDGVAKWLEMNILTL